MPLGGWVFHHWDLRLERPFDQATQGLWRTKLSPETNLESELAEWRRRGVLPQRWRGGRDAYRRGHTSPEALARHWTEPAADGWPGILIDEITDDEKLREVAGRALKQARRLAPDLHIAVYVVPAIRNETLVEGLRAAADLVLVEAYQNNARYDYSRIRDRYQSAIDHGLQDKTLVALGFGERWITTARELRRQLHFIRYHFPEMPGVATFGNLSDDMAASLDCELARFFERPVVRVTRTGPRTLRLTNIGRTAIDGVELSFEERREDGSTARTGRTAIPLSLPPHASKEWPIKPGFHVRTRYDADQTVLTEPLLWEEEPAYLRPAAEQPWPRMHARARVVELTAPPMERSIHRVEKEGAKIARVAVSPTGGAAFAFEYTFEVKRMDRYGRVSLSLEQAEGPGAVSLKLYCGDGESRGFLEMSAQTSDRPLVEETLAHGIGVGDRIKVELLHLPDAYLRARLVDASSGEVLWDTGELPVEGTIAFDQIGLQVRADQESAAIVWDDDGLRLRGVGGAGRGIDLILSELKIFVPSPSLTPKK